MGGSPVHHQHLFTAMTPGYSKLMPNTDALLIASGSDWQMMVLHSGMERSERQWRELIKGVGLKIVGLAGIIEVVKED